VTHDEYRLALDAAVKEFEALGEQRRAIDVRLAQLAQTMTTLSNLLGLTPTVPLGLTDAIRLVMRAGIPLTPIDVRDRLHGIGFDMSKYANELAAVHTILKRLNASGELRFLPRTPGNHQYVINRAAIPIVLGRDIVKRMYENAAEAEAMRAEEPPREGRRKAERTSQKSEVRSQKPEGRSKK